MTRDGIEDRFQFCGRLPIPNSTGLAGVEDQPGNIERPRSRFAPDVVWAKANGAPFTQLRQRHAVLNPSTEVHDARVG